LVGTGGIVVSDRCLGTNRGDKLKARFEKALEEEFTEPDGSILPIRSELTGFTIPGLCGVLTDCVNSTLCAAYLPNIAHRNWAMSARESISYDKNGKLQILNLQGADKIDTGNYKPGEGCVRTIFATAAAEFGNAKISNDCLEQIDNEYFPVEATPTGSLKNKGLSTTGQGTVLRARLTKYQDWTNMMTKGPDKTTLTGPLLASASFPEVLVAKAFSVDGKQLDLVLYAGKSSGTFALGFERLIPGQKYSLSSGQSITADKAGKAEAQVYVDQKRTQIILKASE
jgi:Linalool dehydratase/isomerase